jgi:hypothetical protein
MGRRRGFGRESSDPERTELAGIVLTGGYRPRPRDLEQIQAAGIFCLLVEEDTYAAASEVHDLLVKIHPADGEKIALIKSLVAQHLDIERIHERFASPSNGAARRGPDQRPVTANRRSPVSRLLAALRRRGRRARGSR